MSIIRLALNTDREEMVALLRSFSMSTKNLLQEGSAYWTAVNDDKFAGMIGVEYGDDTSLIRSLAVVPDNQQSGLGKQLLATAMEDARVRGYKDIYTISSTSGDYFLKLGFETIELTELRARLPNAPQVIQFDQEGWPVARKAYKMKLLF